MTDQWQELKETIIELRDSNGTGTQQEVCKFLANYMDILEKQMQESVVSRQAVLDIVDSYSESQSNVEDVTQDIISDIVVLPSVNLQEPKTGHWIETAEEYYKAVNEYGGGVNEDTPYFVDDIACSVCLAKYSVIDNETERFDCCPSCGVKLVEPQERSDKE